MFDCTARWEELWKPDPLWICGGSKYSPLPCEPHGCGYVDAEGGIHYIGVCKCPWPENAVERKETALAGILEAVR